MQDTKSRRVTASLDEGGTLLRVVLAAGKGNIIDRVVVREMREVLAESGAAETLCVILIDHEGEHFSFGASVEEHAPGVVEEMLPALHDLARDLLAFEVPILVAVSGMCLGGGLELAALADRMFAAPSARFGQPETKLGVFAPIGSALLPRILGPRHAADLLLSGRTIDAEEGLRMGLVGEVCEDPAGCAVAWAKEHLTPKSASSLRYATRAARRSWIDGFLADLEHLERTYLDDLMKTHDAGEGIAAFLERRPPRWEGS